MVPFWTKLVTNKTKYASKETKEITTWMTPDCVKLSFEQNYHMLSNLKSKILIYTVDYFFD